MRDPDAISGLKPGRKGRFSPLGLGSLTRPLIGAGRGIPVRPGGKEPGPPLHDQAEGLLLGNVEDFSGMEE